MSNRTSRIVAALVMLAFAAPGGADVQPEVRAVLDKAITALGGNEKLARFHAVSWKGKANLQIGGQEIALVHEGTSSGIDKYRLELELTVGGMSNKVAAAINGDKSWARGNNEPPAELPKEIADFVKDGMHGIRIVHLLPTFKNKDYQLTHLGELKVGDRTAIGIKATRKDRRDVNMFFDKDTGLPIKTDVGLTTPDNMETNVEYHFAEFKDFAGVKHFTKITFKVNDQEYVAELTEVKPEEKVEDSIFEKPG
jgi:hypothetical protein